MTPAVLVPLTLGVAALLGFGWHSMVAENPMLDLRLFGNRGYAAACVTTLFAGAALFGASLLYALYFQIGRGESDLSSGLLLISLSVGTLLVVPISGWLVDRYGGGIVSLTGSLATLVTAVPFAFLSTGASVILVEALLFARGMAIALAVIPATTAAYKAVTRDQLPDATTQVNILQRLGGALGGAIFAVILAANLHHGPDTAFHNAFWWLIAASAFGTVAAGRLAAIERRPGPVGALADR